MEIKVLGSGCKSCKKLLDVTKDAVQNLKVEANIIYVTDMLAIARSGVMKTPALIINNIIVSTGKVLSASEVEALINQYGQVK